ncbi:MAG: A24 family peptidase [Bdellovibrionales bacterium]
MPSFVVDIWVFIVGACFGSFGNLIVDRLPQGKSIVKPASHCMNCDKKLKWYDNIPIISAILLKAKCRSCGSFYGWRTLVFELLMAILFTAIVYKFGITWLSLEFLFFGFGLLVVSFIDIDHRIIPDVFSLSGIVLGLLGAYLNPMRDFDSALWGFLVGGGFLFAIAYFYLLIRKIEGMGGGDIKLLAWIGAYLGIQSILFVIFVASVIGAFAGLISAISSRDGLKSSIPFGPYLAFAAVLYLFFGPLIIDLYFSYLVPSF